ncbi:flagellar basal body rod protein FlgB [Bartonella ancashensis]|uniref:Flagellar basal-body rod protein FlgB n=1 Tax=Bartonella ancashensis TaxID=1318743 RepID=A0A0M4L612_9HYPH|nr:flagellar basal body rod protein FlgB [Bartonella ancashensis]ALE02970.1 Flagellar basal-body rod protein FlgB [Bartonella ancashensis]
MDPVNLFDIANKQAEWLSARQKAVASNVANANTPGYKAHDIQNFTDVMYGKSISMNVTHNRHMDLTESGMEVREVRLGSAGETTHSGNNVDLEEEMSKGAGIVREMSLNTAIVKAFHRMTMLTVRGGS